MFLANDKVIRELPLPSTATFSRRVAGNWSGVRGFMLAMADCLAIFVAVKLSLVLTYIGEGTGVHHRDAIAGVDLIYLVIGAYLAIKGRYTERTPFWQEAYLVVRASLFGIVCETVLGLLNNDFWAHLTIIMALSIFAVLATIGNQLAKYILAYAGIWTIPVVVIGKRNSIAAAEAVLKSDKSLGYDVVGRVDPATVMSGIASPNLQSILDQYQAKSLIIAIDGTETLHQQVIDCALRERVCFATMMQSYPAPTFTSKSTCFFSENAVLLSFQSGLSRPVPRFAKSVTDVVIASTLLVLTAPVLILITAINLLDGGPVLFRQIRVGAGGRPFYCLKFRTMVVDADRVLENALANDPKLALEWETRRKLDDDPRITRFGNFLRKSSLDELPQLINVLRRDMSLVGPRPIVDSEVPLYGSNIAQYYATRPGLTGLWQVSGRSNTTYARRVQLDVWYVNNWTFWHDVAVLLKTIPAVLGRNGAI